MSSKSLIGLFIKRPSNKEQTLVKVVLMGDLIVGVYQFEDEDGDTHYLTVDLLRDKTLSDIGIGYLSIRNALENTKKLLERDYVY